MTEQSLPTIYVDFNNRVGGSLRLSCDGTKADLKRLGINLTEGMKLRVSDGELAASGTVMWATELADWVIAIDMREIEDLNQ